jgi:hypothetical protein
MTTNGTQIVYRSPKNITEDDMNEAIKRQGKYESMHCTKEWTRIMDSKEAYKLILGFMSNPVSFERLLSLFAAGALIGFDLHAARADAGPASMYSVEEEMAEKRALAQNKTKGAAES